MTYAGQEAVIRDVASVDTAEIIDLVAAARRDGHASRRRNAGPAVRRPERTARNEIFVEHPHHPLDPHHDPTFDLAFLAVHPDRQNRGIGSALLDRHHARLDRAGIPAYLEADDFRPRDLALRHGHARRPVLRLPEGPHPWSRWRAPMPR
jgi:ribosomal protein S18 acetylase RimI-like enzyme